MTRFATEYGSLEATLTVPETAGPMPIAVIVPGSGATDRDGNDPRQGLRTEVYRHLAEGLVEAGIACLRYDKRGVGASATPEDLAAPILASVYADDVVDAMKAAETVNGVDQVFLIGHSEGALMSILAAEKHSPAGLILIGAPGRPFGQVIHEQLAAQSIPAEVLQRADEIMTALAAKSLGYQS